MKNRLFAELLSTFCMVFAGCGAIVVDQAFGGIGHVGVSLTFGLVVMAMIYSVGNVSGAHMNPAVTIGFVVSGRLERSALPGYLSAQFGGALAACVLLRLLFPDAPSLGATMPAGSVMQAFAFEFILTFILMVVILNVSTGHKEKGIMAGVAVGGTIALEAMMGGPVSGASMNPARSLGPAVVAGQLEHLWIYLVATVAGAIAATPACRLIQGPDCCGETVHVD